MTKINKLLSLNRPLVMGILNVTPDSFSDGGQFSSEAAALKHVESMIFSGVDIIDIGGESTRPGAEHISLTEETKRVLPILKSIKKEFDIAVSVDTYKPELMADSIDLGADMINDVKALSMPGALDVIAQSNVYTCLMHMQGTPKNMQSDPTYHDAIQDIILFLKRRIQACQMAGIDSERICIDPGFGFGKTLAHNYQMLNQLYEFKSLNVPVLAGLSRKSMIGAVTGKTEHNRVAGSIAAATIAAIKGANIIRVHDVAETIDAIKVVTASQKGEQ